MTDLNPDISNGTCYFSDNEKLTSRFIPCGNAALGHKSCCESQDMCLSSRACYNGQYGVTYMAGCTDPDYQHESCPDKGAYSDDDWVGLVLCHPTFNDNTNTWIACENEGITVSSPSSCSCPSTSRTVAFQDYTQLQNIMSLPASYGGSVTWKDSAASMSAHAGLTTADAAAAASSSTTANSIVTTTETLHTRISTSEMTTPQVSMGTSISRLNSSPTPIQNTTTSLPALPSGGLKTGEKIGIAFGAAGLLVIFLTTAWLCYKYIRRRATPTSPIGTVPQEVTSKPRAELDPELKSPAWSGHKSELAADESTIITPYFRSIRPGSAEIEGSPVPRSPMRPGHDGSLLGPGPGRKYFEMPA